jgi:hypothetical protein
MILNPYYILTPKFLKRIWFLWWLILAFIGWVSTLLILKLFNEEFPLLGVIAFWLLFLFFPLINLITEKMYKNLDEKLDDLYCNGGSFRKWITNYIEQNMFSVRNKYVWIVTIIITSLILVTVLVTGIPFKSPAIKVLSFIGLFVPAFCAGQGAFLIISSLYLLWKLSDFPVKPNYYYVVSASPFKHLYYAYNIFSVIIMVGYALTALLMWQSPIGFHPIFIWFLVFVSLFPLSLLVLSNILIRRIQNLVHAKFLVRINKMFETALTKLEESPTIENLEYVKKLLEIQQNIDKVKLFPIDIQNITVFFASTILPVIQFSLTWFFYKP